MHLVLLCFKGRDMLAHLGMVFKACVELVDVPRIRVHSSIAELVVIGKKVSDTRHVGSHALRPMLVKERLGYINLKSFQA
jgi:hypothetical protein